MRTKKRNRRKESSFDFQTLEKRQLFAADLLSTGSLVGAEVDQAEIKSVQQDMRQQDQSSVQRIVNGQQTSGHDAVGVVNEQCTGTLIAPNAVLTAAHCVEGMSDSQGSFKVNGKTYSTVKMVSHPDYRSDDVDLAVMILSENVEGVTPVELNRITPKVGEMLTLVGFGATGNGDSGHNGDFGVKHEGTTPIDEVTASLVAWNFDNNSESNTAPGDSGGPAFLTQNGVKVIAGVTSGGTKDDASIGDYSFDARVDAFADWIDSVAGSTAGGGGDNGDGDTGGDDNGDTTSNDGKTFTSNQVVNISANSASTVSSKVNVSGVTGKITDVNVQIDIDHTWTEDLNITLISPSGDRIPLAETVGQDGDNFDQTVFDNAATTGIASADAPFRGTYVPMGDLTELNGQDPNGIWRLEVEDSFEEDGGRINSFSVTIATDGGSVDTGDPGNPGQGDELSQLAQKLDLELELYSTGKYFENYGGQNEKWMAGKDSWYFILPNGQLRGPGGKLVATFDSSYHADPKLLHAAGDPTLAIELDNQLGLSSIGNYFEDYGGSGEKWMQGNDGWYFILPNGQLRGPGGRLIAQLDPQYHADPSLLHEAANRAKRDRSFAAAEYASAYSSTDNAFESFGEEDEVRYVWK